jgi:hypothetical protein
MTKCNRTSKIFQVPKSRKLSVSFDGGQICSNGGLVLLKGMDEKIGITKRVAQISEKYDTRNPLYTTHSVRSIISQRIFAIASGHEDLNDHLTLAHDPLLQSVSERDDKLASPSTLCRFERDVSRTMNFELSTLLVETFIESHKTAPKELVLDFDATDSLVHGKQEQCFYYGYYGNYCYLPLYVFCGDQPLVAYLRPSNVDGARHAWIILKLLVTRFRRQWPNVKIVFRADSGFCRHKMFNWCEQNDVKYIVGMPGNNVITQLSKSHSDMVKSLYEATNVKQKEYSEFTYAAKTWTHQRRVIHKAEYNETGDNNRYIVTNLPDKSRHLYEDIYCARGDMENRIKEQQLDLFADRTSSHTFATNQFRLLLSVFAYVIMQRMRALVLTGTQFARAQCQTIRLELIKIGAVIRRNTRRLYVNLSSAYPHIETFTLIINRIVMLQ